MAGRQDFIDPAHKWFVVSHPFARKKAKGWGTETQYLRAGSIDVEDSGLLHYHVHVANESVEGAVH
jgi:hypothetical protein